MKRWLWLLAILWVLAGAGRAEAALSLTDCAGRLSGWAVSIPAVAGVALLSPDGMTIRELLLRHNPFADDPLARAQTLLPRRQVRRAQYFYPATGNYLLAASVAGAAGADSWVYADLLSGEELSTGIPAALPDVAVVGPAPDNAAVQRLAMTLLAQPLTVLAPFPVHDRFRSTHATAAVAVLEYWGLRLPTEPAPVFAGSLAGFATRCLCDDPRKPMVWELKRGIQGLAGIRHQPLAVEEIADGFTFAAYRWNIDNRFPVLLTLAWGEENRVPAWRAYRLQARTVAGIGYMTGAGQYVAAAGGQAGELTLLRWDDTLKLALSLRHEEREPSGLLRTLRLIGDTAAAPNPVTVAAAAAVPETVPAVAPVLLPSGKELHYFFDAACRECLRTDNFLRRLLVSDSGLVLHKYNLKEPEHVAMLLQYYRAYHIPPREWQGTLILFAGPRCFRGYDEIERGLAAVLRAPDASVPAPRVVLTADTALPHEVFAGFSILSVAAAGLADGINPCAFGVLLFFFTCLRTFGRQRREIVPVGLAFATGVYVAYLLIGLGALQALYRLTAVSWLARWLYPVMGALSLLLAIWSLLDWRRACRGNAQSMTLQLPPRLRNYINALIRRRLTVRFIIPGAFAIGLAVSVLELACTGQIYLPVLMYIAGEPGLRFHAVLWLLLYVTMFIVPLMALFGIVYWGSSAVALSALAKRLAVWAKLVMAMIFALLAGYMWHIALQLF